MSAAVQLYHEGEDPGICSDQTGVRRLPIYRVREHMSVEDNWVPVLNDLMTAQLEKRELAVLLTILFLRPKQHLHDYELRVLSCIRAGAMRDALASLVRRHILFFDVLHYSDDEEKKIWHIASPFHWKISGWQNARYSKGATDPAQHVTRHLSEAPAAGRQDEYGPAACASKLYVRTPRILGELDLRNHAKRIWLYLASLRATWHPTAKQIADAVGVSKSTALVSLSALKASGLLAVKDHRHAKRCTRLERTYHTVHPAFWHFDNSVTYKKPDFSISQDAEIIKYIEEGKKGKSRGSNPEIKRVKSGNQDGKKGKSRGSNPESGSSSESLLQQGLQTKKSACDDIPCEHIPREHIPGEDFPSPACRRIRNDAGNASWHITHLVADHVEYAFQTKAGKVYAPRLNEWIAAFTEEESKRQGSVERGFMEAEEFCRFIGRSYAGRRFYARDPVFRQMEAEWRLQKTMAASTEPRAGTHEEIRNPAPERENSAHTLHSTETAPKSPDPQTLTLIPGEVEPSHQPAIFGVESNPVELPVPAEQKAMDSLPDDPNRQQWLVARVYAKARPSQRKDLDALWAKKPGRILPMLRFFSGMDFTNGRLVDEARAELDGMCILRKSEIPPFPWSDSGEFVQVPARAPAPKQSEGDGTLPLPLTRERLKRALRKLNQEPDLKKRFEIDGWFIALSEDGQFHSEMVKRYGAAAVERKLNGNN